jgi:hypothetical protein
LLYNEDFKTIIHSLPPRNERVHKTDESKAKSLFTLFCFILPNNWEQLLFIATLAINGRTSFIIGFSSFFATHGYNIKPIEMKESLKTKGIILTAKKKAFISKLKNVTKMAQTIITAGQEKYEIYANIYR